MNNLTLIAFIILIALVIVCIVSDYHMDKDTVHYHIKFMSMWGNDPRINYPPNPHTGNMFLVSHDDKFKLFELDKYANKGVSQTAMFGTLDDLYVVAENNKKHIGNVVTSGVLQTPGSTDLLIGVTPSMSEISFVTMIAPSSDWFTGFSIDLAKDGEWIDQTIIPLYVFIAGTDSNQGFVTEHKLRSSPEPIKINNDKLLYPNTNGQVVPIAYAIINKLKKCKNNESSAHKCV